MVKISAARLDLQSGRVDNAILKDYAETLVGGFSGTNSGGTYTVSLASGNVFYLILNSNCTFVFNPPTTYSSGSANYFTLLLQQDGTGNRLAAWPLTVAWPGDIPPILSTVANHWDLLFFFTVNGGGTWYGDLCGSSYQ